MSKIAITPDFDIDESDLKDLAWSWYFTTQEIEYISAKNALAILSAIVGRISEAAVSGWEIIRGSTSILTRRFC